MYCINSGSNRSNHHYPSEANRSTQAETIMSYDTFLPDGHLGFTGPILNYYAREFDRQFKDEREFFKFFGTKCDDYYVAIELDVFYAELDSAIKGNYKI